MICGGSLPIPGKLGATSTTSNHIARKPYFYRVFVVRAVNHIPTRSNHITTFGPASPKTLYSAFFF